MFRLNAHLIPCALSDVDECEKETDNCNDNAECINTEWSFECECNEGFEGDGVNCDGMWHTLLNIKIVV